MRRLCAKSRRGFTLIELLVVIAIIAILAALLFPVFVKAKQKGKMAGCMSNLRQVSMAVIQYSGDHDSGVPRTCTVNAADKPNWSTVNSFYRMTNGTYRDIRRYIKNDQVFLCTEDCDYERAARDAGAPYEVEYRFNEAMNYSTKPSEVSPRCKRLDECTLPKKFYLVADRHSTHHFAKGDENQNSWVMPMAMADGHVYPCLIYARVARDSQNGIIAYHWDFPRCHADDYKVVVDYFAR
jgi:prepilin-type N-terminal cleavage/methylation domain-containing protein